MASYSANWTPEKEKAYHRDYYRRNREEMRTRALERHARTRYGLSRADIEAMREKQEGKCLLCGRTPKVPLHVDHCHATGKVRGLLCGTCNQAIGLLRDDPVLMRAAAKYVEDARG